MIRLSDTILRCASISILSISMGVAAAKEQIKPLESITIQLDDERAQFILKKSKKLLYVKGFNYVRLCGDHATFDAETKTTKAHYDPKQAEAMFRILSKSGYNTVRVFIIGRSKANP